MKRDAPADESPEANVDDSPQESRRYARRPMNQPIEFALPDGERRAGICRNISLGGMHIDVREPAAFGAAVTIFMQLPGIDDAALPGVVRWTEAGGMGVQLGLFGARITHAIIRIIAGS